MLGYRSKQTRNGRPLPWKSIEIQVSNALAVRERYRSQKDNLISQERMRRFANREEIPSPDKLDQLALFLASKELLTDELLDQPSPHFQEAMAVHEYLAACTDRAKEKIGALRETYVATKDEEGRSFHVELRIIREWGETVFAVEEIVTEVDTQRPANEEERANGVSLFRKDQHVSSTRKRTGYGFIATNAELLYVFLCGPFKQRVNYIEVSALRTAQSRLPLALILHGDQSAARQFDFGQPETYNVYRFAPMEPT